MRTLWATVLVIALSGCVSTPSGLAPTASTSRATAPFSEITESLAIRQRYGLDLSESRPSVLIQSMGIHHTRRVFSTVATRNIEGVWVISSVGEETSGLLRMEPTLIPETIRQLTPVEGRALDTLIGSRALYRETRRVDGRLGVGSPEHVMEIVGTSDRVVVSWTGRLRGRAGQIADLILGTG